MNDILRVALAVTISYTTVQ